jgi:hypothetical protein
MKQEDIIIMQEIVAAMKSIASGNLESKDNKISKVTQRLNKMEKIQENLDEKLDNILDLLRRYAFKNGISSAE